MAIAGWILDKSAAARAGVEPFASQLADLAGQLFICPVGELEQLYSARSAEDYDRAAEKLRQSLPRAEPPPDIFDRALKLQRDLARHRAMWHRTPIPDLLIAESALHHRLGVVHVDRDFERIAKVRALTVRRLG